MTTAPCPVCHMHYLVVDGRVRRHGTNMLQWCRGSGMEPAQPRVFAGWLK